MDARRHPLEDDHQSLAVGLAGRFAAYRPAERTSFGSALALSPLANEVPEPPATARLVEWIESGTSCSNVLRFASNGAADRPWVEPLARELRLRGFVPVSV